jgi:hypothetical protein
MKIYNEKERGVKGRMMFNTSNSMYPRCRIEEQTIWNAGSSLRIFLFLGSLSIPMIFHLTRYFSGSVSFSFFC